MTIFDADRWHEIWITITRNKTRSLLTAFGVFWGVFMLTVMSGSGRGLQIGFMSQLQGFATNSAIFWTDQTSLPYKGFRKGRFFNLKISDLEILKTEIKNIQYISPILSSRRTNNVLFEEKAGSYTIKGILADYNKIIYSDYIYGRGINEIDIQLKRKVCVIGEKVYEDLLEKGKNPVGTLIRISGMYYTIVGVSKGNKNISISGRDEESVVIPVTTMQQAYNYGDNINLIIVAANNNVKISVMEEQIKTILKRRHDIAPDDVKAIGGVNFEKQFSMFQNLFVGVDILIWIVGLGTLLAGIVGISNIMLVTVKERTKEIGVRRALGAKPNSIISQIMSESLILTLIAGFCGLMTGVSILEIVKIAAKSSDNTIFSNLQISFSVAIASVMILTISGLFAGLIPAVRALKIKAIDAIREE